jgi:hypothetical protein
MGKYFVRTVIIVGILLVAGNFTLFNILVNKIRNDCETKQLLTERDLYQVTGIFNNFVEENILQYRVSGSSLHGDKNILDELATLSKNGYLFVFRFDESACETCVESALHDLAKFETFHGNSQIVILKFPTPNLPCK